ncbi:MAG: hypothetical protein JW913_03425, partial [Chitinispirillaceae bacterium]|nr:hypothetical protein [Chitinispirillaceae bacterium]
SYDMIINAAFKDKSGGDLVDDCEDGDGLTRMGSDWFTYNDSKDTGKSTITPLTERGVKLLTMTSGGFNSSKYAVKIEYKLDKGGFAYNPFVGVGFEMKKDQTSLDISKSTGLSFAYKGTFGTGDTCAIKCESDAVTQLGASYSYTLAPSASWKEISISWSEFLQPKWVTDKVDLDLKCVPKIQWQIQGATNKSGELWIDDVHLIDFDVPVKNLIPNNHSTPPLHLSLKCTHTSDKLTVSFATIQHGPVLLSLYDLTGRLVKTLTKGYCDAGGHAVRIDTRDMPLSSSSYLVSLKTTEGTFTRQVVLNR